MCERRGFVKLYSQNSDTFVLSNIGSEIRALCSLLTARGEVKLRWCRQHGSAPRFYPLTLELVSSALTSSSPCNTV
jgi:hypothetical protein